MELPVAFAVIPISDIFERVSDKLTLTAKVKRQKWPQQRSDTMSDDSPSDVTVDTNALRKEVKIKLCPAFRDHAFAADL